MATIKNFGFMWERDKVVWGKPGPGGTSSLEGVMVGNRTKRVQFAEQTGIYTTNSNSPFKSVSRK